MQVGNESALIACEKLTLLSTFFFPLSRSSFFFYYPNRVLITLLSLFHFHDTHYQSTIQYLDGNQGTTSSCPLGTSTWHTTWTTASNVSCMHLGVFIIHMSRAIRLLLYPTVPLAIAYCLYHFSLYRQSPWDRWSPLRLDTSVAIMEVFCRLLPRQACQGINSK